MAARNSINAKGEAAPQPVKVQRYWPGKAPVSDISTSNTITTTSTKAAATDAQQINGHDEEEDLEARRVRIKQKALEKRRQEEERLKALEEAEKAKEISFKDKNEEEEDSESEEEEASSEYETDSENEEESSRKLLKPIFIPKKKESHAMLAEQIQKELQKESVEKATAIEDVDDTDGLDEQAEYEAWKLRELKRIKRDKEERNSREREKREIEERRNMNEKQRLKEDLELVKKQREEKSKGHYKFLQKYYHKGAFYLNNEDEIFKRDYTEATPDEAVMQVKNFGRAGQTKWTHLADQDTSKKDSAWTQKSDINKRTATKLGGLHGGFEKPTSKKRKT
ncbi:7600_t:CDS:2 [Entrophospora sp. SA101]|nr:7600_t:CDS:2 [Entrophospora sp. SA101]